MFRQRLKRAAKMACPPLLWTWLRQLVFNYRWARAGLAATSNEFFVHNLAEIDRAIARADAAARISDDELRKCFNFTFVPGELHLPADPDSPAYRQAQMALYERISGRTNYDPAVDEQTPIVPSHITQPFPYSTRSFATVGDQLMSVGFLIRAMGLPAGGSILEFGPGWGLSTLELVQMGYDVTAVDVNQQFLDLIAERARRLGQRVSLVCSDMLKYRPERQFDRVLFYECFHHASDHLRLLDNLDAMVAPNGAVVFAGEPIVDDFYCPWGVRLDGQSVWAIRKCGWLELGFRTDYFRKALDRRGWHVTIQQSKDLGLMRAFVATRK
jgi:2-polyprenyl-3-methyl-5-hydroxy-6-metoxy-1,4-benzoquinol methylase